MNNLPPEDIIMYEDNTTISSVTTSGAIDINFRRGLAGNCILGLLQQAMKDKKCLKTFSKRKESNKSLYDHLIVSKRITTGVVFNTGHVNLIEKRSDGSC